MGNHTGVLFRQIYSWNVQKTNKGTQKAKALKETWQKQTILDYKFDLQCTCCMIIIIIVYVHLLALSQTETFRCRFLLRNGSACWMYSTSIPFPFVPQQLPMMSPRWIPLITRSACVDFTISDTVGLSFTLPNWRTRPKNFSKGSWFRWALKQ